MVAMLTIFAGLWRCEIVNSLIVSRRTFWQRLPCTFIGSRIASNAFADKVYDFVSYHKISSTNGKKVIYALAKYVKMLLLIMRLAKPET
jgi:hypothetical protein